MMAAASRQETEVLKMFQDSGRYPGFFPAEDDFEAQRELLQLVPNLGVLDLAEGAWAGGPSVKQSLGNVLCLTRPTIIIDEGQTAYTETRRKTLAKFNPSFILELSATPNKGKEQMSNVLHSVSGMALKKEQMVKLPLELHNARQGDWKDTLAAAHGKLGELQKLADLERDETGRYVRPILLVGVEQVGKNQTEAGKIHANDVRKFLCDALRAKEGEVAEKSSVEDELSAHDLKEEKDPAIRYIITKDALREGWDCSFAYVLAMLDDYPITHKGTGVGEPVAKSLFEPIWSKHFNELEKPVALYLDDLQAVRWWHRIAVQADWYLDGGKKKRVFPDFFVELEETDGKFSRLVVVETKGLHLKNEDTDYKRRLFETLERHSESGVPVGALTLDDQPGPLRFRLVLEGDWKLQVDAALATTEY